MLVMLLVLSLVGIGWTIQTTFLTPGPGTLTEKATRFATVMGLAILPIWLGIFVLYRAWLPKKPRPPKS